MAKYLMMAFTTPAAGKDAQFNEWYDKHHLPEVLQVPGVKSGRRYNMASPGMPGGTKVLPGQYLAIYEIETDDLNKFYEGMFAKAPSFTPSDSFDAATGGSAFMFVPAGDWVQSKG
jgi:hypothetical protein